MRRTILATLLAAGLLGTAACDNDIDNPGPTEPAPTTTDEFTGTLTVNGAQTHVFAVVANGRVTATLTELITTDATIAVGLILGTFNGRDCTTVIANNSATQGAAVIGDAAGIGTLCVRVHDVGKLTAPQDYKLSVVHP